MSLSMFQNYKNTQKVDVDFSSIHLKKIEDQKIVKNIALNIFESFNCSKFHEQSIENFNEIYEPKNSQFRLLNFKPKSNLFSFLNFININSEVTFNLDEFSKLEKLDISYTIIQLNDFLKDVKKRVLFTFDKELKLNSIMYDRTIKKNEGFLKTRLLKTSDMLCPEEEESFLLELFLLNNKNDFFEMFHECYFIGNKIPEMKSIKEKHDILDMIYI